MEVRQAILARSYPREKLVEVLTHYQTTIHNLDAPVSRQLNRLRDSDALCAVTGQQVGFATGPIFTVLKAISVVVIARQRGCVPLFWAHTEDHDTAEVAAATLLAPSGDLHRYAVKLPSGLFVEEIEWTEEQADVLGAFMDAAAVERRFWEDAVVGASRYAQAMVGLLAKLLRGSGLLFLEPSILRPLATDFFQTEIEQVERFRAHLQQSAPLVAPAADATNLFYKDEAGRRLKITQERSEFAAKGNKWSRAALMEEIDRHPERFSPNAAARPLLQSALLPAEVYVAGPHEAKYLAQLEEYHKLHGLPVPHLIPRLSTTLIPPWAQEALERLRLEPEEIGVDSGAIEDQRKAGLAAGLPPRILHALRNLLRPRGEPQERILNWWQFQALRPELVRDLLDLPPGGVAPYFRIPAR
jgi:bacillithiol synthase